MAGPSRRDKQDGAAQPQVDEARLYALALGGVVGALRESRGLHQGELAKAAGLTQTTLSRLENGKHLPDAFRVQVIASALGLTADALNARVRQALEEAEKASRTFTGKRSGDRWWESICGSLGTSALEGLVTFGVAVALNRDR